MTTKDCFFIKTEGPDSAAFKRGLAWLVNKSKNTGFLAVMGYGNLDGIIRDVIGDAAIKSLKKDGRVRANQKEIFLITERKMIRDAGNEPILAVYPSEKYLDEVDSITNCQDMLVVPWLFKDIETWIITRNAAELGKATQPTTKLIQNPVVEEAMKSLVGWINTSTGISHPRDKERTIWTLTILRDAGERFTPEEIKSWLISEGGLKAPFAEDVKEVAAKVLEGRHLKKGERAWREDILDIWRKQAKDSNKSSLD